MSQGGGIMDWLSAGADAQGKVDTANATGKWGYKTAEGNANAQLQQLLQQLAGKKYDTDKQFDLGSLQSGNQLAGVLGASGNQLAGTLGASKNQMDAAKYGADQGLAGIMGASNNQLAGNKYGADQTLAGQKYGADANVNIANTNIKPQMEKLGFMKDSMFPGMGNLISSMFGIENPFKGSPQAAPAPMPVGPTAPPPVGPMAPPPAAAPMPVGPAAPARPPVLPMGLGGREKLDWFKANKSQLPQPGRRSAQPPMARAGMMR